MRNRFAVRVLGVLTLSMALLGAQGAWAHCQIPCGIYNDELRFDLLEEHITTIEKSMNMIEENMAELGTLPYDAASYANQMLRWIQNKENHADKFTKILTYYFLAQRIKPVEDGDELAEQAYIQKVSLIHEMVFEAMKAKQTVDLDHVEAMRDLLAEFEVLYMGEAAASGMSPEEYALKKIDELVDAVLDPDADYEELANELLARVSEDFYHYEVPDKETLADYIQMGIDMGYVDQIPDFNIDVDMEDAQVEIEDDEATVGPIYGESDLADVTVELRLKKEADGKWRMVGADVQEGISRPEKVSPEEAILGQIRSMVDACLAEDADYEKLAEELLARVSDDFYHYEVPDKETLADYIQMGIDMGYAEQIDDFNVSVDLSDASVEIDGDKATVYPIYGRSDMGDGTLDLNLKKEEDGVWRITTVGVQQGIVEVEKEEEPAEAAPAASDEEAVINRLQSLADTLLAEDPDYDKFADQILDYISEDFSHYEVPDKQTVADYLEMGIEMGYAEQIGDFGVTVDLSQAAVTIEGDTATVYPVYGRSDMGNATAEITLKKESDGEWRIVTVDGQEGIIEVEKKAAKAGGAGEEQAIIDRIQSFVDAILAEDADYDKLADQLLARVSEDFSHYEVPDKATLADYIRMGVDMGYVEQADDYDVEVSLDDAEVEIDGDTATVYPIDASATLGYVTIELTLKKEDDGVWRIVTAGVEGI